MSWRTVVISSNAKLDYQMDFIVGEKTGDVLTTTERLVIL